MRGRSHNTTIREPGFGLAIASLLIAVVGILLPIPAYLELYNTPVGTTCRPMGAAVAVFLGGVGAPLLAILFALLAFSGGRISRRLGIVAGILSLTPLPLYWWLFRWIVSAHSLILEA